MFDSNDDNSESMITPESFPQHVDSHIEDSPDNGVASDILLKHNFIEGSNSSSHINKTPGKIFEEEKNKDAERLRR